MNILITGANGYIGQRLIPVLLQEGHQLYCCVRNRKRFEGEHSTNNIHIIEVDFLETQNKLTFPVEIDVAYYLIHSMSSGKDFDKLEASAAWDFLQKIETTNCRQIIYLTGIVNEDHLSKHLSSRLAVENILKKRAYSFNSFTCRYYCRFW